MSVPRKKFNPSNPWKLTGHHGPVCNSYFIPSMPTWTLVETNNESSPLFYEPVDFWQLSYFGYQHFRVSSLYSSWYHIPFLDGEPNNTHFLSTQQGLQFLPLILLFWFLKSKGGRRTLTDLKQRVHFKRKVRYEGNSGPIVLVFTWSNSTGETAVRESWRSTTGLEKEELGYYFRRIWFFSFQTRCVPSKGLSTPWLR